MNRSRLCPAVQSESPLQCLGRWWALLGCFCASKLLFKHFVKVLDSLAVLQLFSHCESRRPDWNLILRSETRLRCFGGWGLGGFVSLPNPDSAEDEKFLSDEGSFSVHDLEDPRLTAVHGDGNAQPQTSYRMMLSNSVKTQFIRSDNFMKFIRDGQKTSWTIFHGFQWIPMGSNRFSVAGTGSQTLFQRSLGGQAAYILSIGWFLWKGFFLLGINH